MSQSNIEQLNEQLTAANAALDEALASGADTTAVRYTIGQLEAEIAAVVRRQREEQAEAERAEQAAIAAVAAELAAQTHSATVAAVDVPGLSDLAGELNEVQEDPEIAWAARDVAKARAALAQAETSHKPLVEKASNYGARLAEKRAASDAIRARRVAGDERDGDGAELAVLQDDIRALTELHNAALSAAAAQDGRPAARAAVTQAESLLEGRRKRLAFDAARARLLEAERVYLAAWNIMAETGRAIGKHSPWSECPASNEMKRAVTGSLVGMHGL